MKIIVTGATGLVARHIVPYLHSQGVNLVLVGRSTLTLKEIYPELQSCDYEDLEDHLLGADALLHLAVRNNDQQGTLADFRDVNVELVKRLVTQAQNASLPYFCQISTLHTQNQINDVSGTTPYAQSKAEAEAYLSTVPGIKVLTLRLAAVYGKDQYTGKLGLLYKVPKMLRPIVFKMLAALRPTTHADLIGPAVLHAVQNAQSQQSEEYPAEPIQVTDGQKDNWLYAGVMFTIDLLFVLFVVGLLWWLLIGVWIMVKLTSDGPGILAQERVGKNGSIFKCYKFRTMFAGTKQAGTHNLTTASITKVGHILRKTKIDELPQILNILRNEVSLIGPRPSLPVQKELIEARRVRGVLSVKPGISGWAQIQGIDMSKPIRLAQMDADYIARRSIPFDLKIMIATAIGRGQGDKVNT